MSPDPTPVRVYTDMVGDLFHWGHVTFLERARRLGTELWVGVHADDDVTNFKRRPIMSYDERIAVIAACRYVDNIIPAAPLVITDELLDANEIDIVVHGDDFSPQVLKAVYGVPLRRGMLRTVPYSHGVSTTDIIGRLQAQRHDVPPPPSGLDPALDALRRTRTNDGRRPSSSVSPLSPPKRRLARTVLLNPGPVNLDDRVRQALTVQDMCHREPDAYALLAAVRRKVTEVSGGASSHSAVVLTGSGTSAIEATLSSVVPSDGELLILSNGHFGERLAAIAEIYRLPSRVWDEGWGHSYDFDGIERLLVDNASITHVAMVHHETSTGQLNDVRRVGELTAALGRCLIVDAVSSLGGEDLDVARDHVDWCVTSSNKCVEAPPGLAFVIGAKQRVSELEHIPERSLYLSLCRHYESQADRGVPLFTPSLPLMSSALCALELLVAEGVLQRRARYRRLAETLREGLAQLGLPLYLPDPSTRSSTSTNVALPPGVSFQQLRRELRAVGFVVYPCNDELPGYFRVANMGQVALEDIEAFLARMSERRRLAA